MSVGDQDYWTTNVGSTGTTTFWWKPTEEYKRYLETIKGEWKRLPIPYPNSPESKYLEKDPIKEGVEMKKLYEVIAVYGEDRKAPLIMKPSIPFVIAENDEEAKLKSGIYDQINAIPDIEVDYLTIICRVIGEVKIKERAKEVKQV